MTDDLVITVMLWVSMGVLGTCVWCLASSVDALRQRVEKLETDRQPKQPEPSLDLSLLTPAERREMTRLPEINDFEDLPNGIRAIKMAMECYRGPR